MIVRSRIRAALQALAVYAVLGSASAYLVMGASQGDHGLKAMALYQVQLADLNKQLSSLKNEHDTWERRVQQMSQQSVSRDLLEEEAHTKLNRLDKNEVVVLLTPQPPESR